MSNVIAEEYYNKVVGNPKTTYKVMQDKYTGNRYKFEEKGIYFLKPYEKRKSRLKRKVKYLIHENKFKPKFMFTFTFRDEDLVPIDKVGSVVSKFWNKMNSLSKKGYMPEGKRIGAVEEGKKTKRVHWHDLVNHEFTEMEEFVEGWEGKIWFRNLYTKGDISKVVGKHFRSSRKVKNLVGGAFRFLKGLNRAIVNRKMVNTFLTLINNDCKTREQMVEKIKPFIVNLMRKYGKDISYYIRIFESKRYKCWSAYVLMDVVVKEAWRICKGYKHGHVDIEYLDDPQKGIGYAFGYVFKNFPEGLKYGSGYSYSRGLPTPPKGWRYNEKKASGVIEFIADQVIEKGETVMQYLDVVKEVRAHISNRTLCFSSIKVVVKKAARQLKKIRRLNQLFGSRGFNLYNFNESRSNPFDEIRKQERMSKGYGLVRGEFSKEMLLDYIRSSKVGDNREMCTREMLYDRFIRVPIAYVDMAIVECKTRGNIMDVGKDVYLFLKYG